MIITTLISMKTPHEKHSGVTTFWCARGHPVGIIGQMQTMSNISSVITALLMSVISIRYRHKTLLLVGLTFLAVSALGCSFSARACAKYSPVDHHGMDPDWRIISRWFKARLLPAHRDLRDCIGGDYSCARNKTVTYKYIYARATNGYLNNG